MRKTSLQAHQICSVQKNPLKKKNKYFSNDTTLKIGHLPKAIAQEKVRAFPKWSVWVKKLTMPKTCKRPFYQNIKVVLCKKNTPKGSKYSRNETNIKIGHLAKGYSLCEMVSLG